MTAYTLMSIIKAKTELENTLITEKERYETFLRNYYCKKNELNAIENELKHNLDIEKFNHGKDLLSLTFPCKQDYYSKKRTYSMIYDSLISDAKKDISEGALYLKEKYIGQKRYEGFDQRTDCKYGMGPSHGNIYQKIGLKNPEQELSEYDLECCLYVLENLDIVLENLNH